jgi:agmatine deiminase
MPAKQSLPAEWTRQAGIILVWPHERTDWTETLDSVERTYVQIAREITSRERLLIVCYDECHRARIHSWLYREDVNLAAVRFATAPFNDTWIRDYGPLTVLREDTPKLLDFCFNAWGERYSAGLDDTVTRALHNQGVFGEIALERLPLVLEGGSIDVDGAGSLLTTRSCLLAPTRNPHLNQSAMESRLMTYFGLERVLWLQHGCLAGDDTDGHIDMLARFCDQRTIAYTACDNPADEHYTPLKAMEAELQSFHTLEGKPYRLISLPLPAPLYNAEGQRLPASYSNFLIINQAVLLPAYDDPADAVANQRLQQAFPAREIVGIDCTALIHQYGSLHCMTLNLPYDVAINDASGISTTRQQR